ncbi:triple functional domain protein [Mytilus galloprovincialis]|uniref:Triple functional domain protein n=1 Tax=Mytilus galloprovincialis TaxID=29158 RepID=A0A8B6H3N2_MYTGA|nr:triple functional domain protein [Mytilus galloprovincialis]
MKLDLCLQLRLFERDSLEVNKMKLDLCLQLRLFERDSLEVNKMKLDLCLQLRLFERDSLEVNKMKLDLCLQLRLFERDSLEVNKMKLDLCLQLRLFERDSLEVSSQLELWAEELQHQELGNEGSKAEQLLQAHNESVLLMQNCTFEVLQRGQDLIQVFENSGIQLMADSQDLIFLQVFENSGIQLMADSQDLIFLQVFENSGIQLMADSQCEAQSRIQALLEYLHEREMDLEAIAESKRERLEQLVQLRNFEVEARQVIYWIDHGKSMLISCFTCPNSLMEAESLKKEHEQFMHAIEKTNISMAQVTQRAENMIQAHHFNSDLIRAIAENVTFAWQQLMYHTEERHKLVMASMNWYKTAEQVWSVLESLDADYKRDEDWCSTERANTGDKANYLLQLINKHNEQKEAFLKACTLARRTAESFLKYVNRNLHTFGSQIKFRSPEKHVKGEEEENKISFVEKNIIKYKIRRCGYIAGKDPESIFLSFSTTI